MATCDRLICMIPKARGALYWYDFAAGCFRPISVLQRQMWYKHRFIAIAIYLKTRNHTTKYMPMVSFSRLPVILSKNSKRFCKSHSNSSSYTAFQILIKQRPKGLSNGKFMYVGSNGRMLRLPLRRCFTQECFGSAFRWCFSTMCIPLKSS